MIVVESRNASPFTTILEGRSTLLMNLLTRDHWFVLYPRATFSRRGTIHSMTADCDFEAEFRQAGYKLSWGTLCEGSHNSECLMLRRDVSNHTRVACMAFSVASFPCANATLPVGARASDRSFRLQWRKASVCEPRGGEGALEDTASVSLRAHTSQH